MFSWYFLKYGFLLDFVIPTLRWVVLLRFFSFSLPARLAISPFHSLDNKLYILHFHK